MTKVAKWWLVVALISIAPIALADRDRGGCDPRHPDKRCQQVPEGGSTAIYLIGAGLISLGRWWFALALEPLSLAFHSPARNQPAHEVLTRDAGFFIQTDDLHKAPLPRQHQLFHCDDS